MSQIIYPITHLPPVIDIGKQTEKGVTRIGFDVHEWLDDWPGMVFSVQPTRPGETESYLAASEMVGSVIFWLVGAEDTEKPGSGTVEVLGVTEDERKLSFMCRTSIANTNTATTAEIPEPNQPWVDKVILAGESAKADAKEAKDSAEQARKSAESMQDFFIVKTRFISNTNPQKTDKTQAEIIEAIEAGKVCMLVATLYNRVYDSASIEDGAPVFRRYGFDNKTNKSFAETVTVNADNTVTSFYTEPILTPSPGVLHFRGAVNASYNGDKHVTVEIPAGCGLPETADPLKQLVTDADGMVAWEDRLAYKTTAEIVNLEETAPTYDETDACFYLLSPWAADLMVGAVATVKYNGTDYECKTFDGKALQPDAQGEAVVMGNLAAMGLEGVEGSNPNAPFALVAIPNGDLTEGLYGILIPLDGATAVTLSVTSKQTQTTVKPIDPELLGIKKIDIIVAEDNTVSCDFPFEEAWAMDEGLLSASIRVQVMNNSYTTHTNTASYYAPTVYKYESKQADGSATTRYIRIACRSTPDMELYDVFEFTEFIQWANVTVQSGGSVTELRYTTQQGMPITRSGSTRHYGIAYDRMMTAMGLPDNSTATAGAYMRFDGSKWVAVTIDQLKADLGLT